MSRFPEWNTQHIKPAWTTRRIFRLALIAVLVIFAALTALSAGAASALIVVLFLESPVIYAIMFPGRARSWVSDVTSPQFALLLFGSNHRGEVCQRTMDDEGIVPVNAEERWAFDHIASQLDPSYPQDQPSLNPAHPDSQVSLNTVEQYMFRRLSEHYDD